MMLKDTKRSVKAKLKALKSALLTEVLSGMVRVNLNSSLPPKMRPSLEMKQS
jgi:hypothetical protein